MLGFELEIGGEISKATIEPEKMITIAVSKTVNGVFLNFGGTDFRSLENLTWVNKELMPGDHISVEIKEIGQESEPIEVHESVCGHSASKDEQQQELKQFYEWQRILQEKGLI